MKLLLIDTCGADGSVALAETGLEVRRVREATMPGRTSSERLLPEIRGLMEDAGCRVGELDAIGVVAGPGSFTGVRVGVAAAKGLCEAAGVPLVMVSRLRVLAHKVLADKAGGPGGRTHALLDAGRGEFFYGRFGEPGEDGLEALLGREEVRAATADGVVAACEESVRAALPELSVVCTAALRAGDALGLVLARVERRAFDDIAASDANYLRRTDAEVLALLAGGR